MSLNDSASRAAGLGPGLPFERELPDRPPGLSRMQHALGSAARLPASPTPLLGRERELVEVQVRLLRDDVRLLTLTGAGGSGKTRLAVEAARSLAERFLDGVCFVDLSSLSEPSQIVPAV